tara:strand:- start:6362 stop:7369 length:1008 start_codon:yes stop_codon:yes gene_type:complete
MKISIVRIDKMGDMILTLPVIQGLKVSNKSNTIDIVCSKKNIKICNRFNTINKIFLFENNFTKIIKTILKLRMENYDYIFTFSPGVLSILISIFSKSKTKSLLVLQSRYKNNFKSKILEKIIGKLFYKNIIIVDRKLRFSKSNSIHQTHLMNELVIKSGLEIKKNEEIKHIFQFKNDNYGLKKLCLIHLSSKWINKYFSEDNFINLINKLKNLNMNIVMTTDDSSKNVFSKIFEQYECIGDNKFKYLKKINKIIILDRLTFDNWISIINSSTHIITPECGCTHVASLSNSKLCVIYDADNLPNMIASEYAPWKKSYIKLLTNDKKLEEKLLLFSN